MVLRYADANDLMLLVSGVTGALAFGICLPGFCYFFGAMIDETANVAADTDGGTMSLETQSYYMIGIGAVSFVMAWWQISCLSVFAENICHKIKVAYFKAVLEKDATWFDHNNPT
jgi:hypothetical protein